jgi:hypothetical protein
MESRFLRLTRFSNLSEHYTYTALSYRWDESRIYPTTRYTLTYAVCDIPLLNRLESIKDTIITNTNLVFAFSGLILFVSCKIMMNVRGIRHLYS